MKPSRSQYQSKKQGTLIIHPDDIIESPFICTQQHRAYFQSIIGTSFKFNTAFQHYLKNVAGETYGDAVKRWYQIQEDQKTSPPPIGKQFEYNTYIRDFYQHNPGQTLQKAIRCWKYKKSQAGHNRYETADLDALEAEEFTT